jgi:hypothetical protein
MWWYVVLPGRATARDRGLGLFRTCYQKVVAPSFLHAMKTSASSLLMLSPTVDSHCSQHLSQMRAYDRQRNSRHHQAFEWQTRLCLTSVL